MYKLAGVLEENKENYAQYQRNGKIIGQSRKEIEKCIWICRYYADNTRFIGKRSCKDRLQKVM
jgi:succinate-semialdehyde dehydrogenase/glutarate-semialdehyde dehydrogenase